MALPPVVASASSKLPVLAWTVTIMSCCKARRPSTRPPVRRCTRSQGRQADEIPSPSEAVPLSVLSCGARGSLNACGKFSGNPLGCRYSAPPPSGEKTGSFCARICASSFRLPPRQESGVPTVVTSNFDDGSGAAPAHGWPTFPSPEMPADAALRPSVFCQENGT